MTDGKAPRSGLFKTVLIVLAVAEVVIPFVLWRFSRPAAAPTPVAPPSLSVAASLSALDTRGFARAFAPRPFFFPADHGPHADFRTEWWYYTGNLTAAGGRRFGFQLTFFRVALAPNAPAAPPAASTAPGATPPRTSAWATRQIYFAHFAVTDVDGKRFQAHERWERQALGLAGAQAAPFRVWVGDWSASATGAGGTPPMRLIAAAGGAPGSGGRRQDEETVGIDLVVKGGPPPVPQGDRGLSAKSAEPGNASYYYSLPRLAASGTVRLGGASFAVSGLAWMDREWSTSSLGAGEVGWDWFALQLDDGWELMLYRLRRQGGDVDPASRVTLIAPDGSTRLLPFSALRYAATGSWTSPGSGTRYPAAWHLEVPDGGDGRGGAWDLVVHPLLADQELPLSLRYWEGAAAVQGSHGGRAVAGRGYVELTGYGDGAAAAQAPR
jgi:predicted secreted hydrolase